MEFAKYWGFNSHLSSYSWKMAAVLQSTSAISSSDGNKATQNELLNLSRSPTELDSLLIWAGPYITRLLGVGKSREILPSTEFLRRFCNNMYCNIPRVQGYWYDVGASVGSGVALTSPVEQSLKSLKTKVYDRVYAPRSHNHFLGRHLKPVDFVARM